MQPVKFFIGIPTFQRPELLDRAIESIIKQEYTNYEIIVVDDSGKNNQQEHDSPYLKDSRVHYLVHKTNLGVNQARNNLVIKANELDPEAYIVFIDDDDYLIENALSVAASAITEHPEYNWFTLDCITPAGNKISRLKHYGKLSYLNDYMFGKSMRGDMMHIVNAKAIGNIRFSDKFKNGEEWYFFIQLSLKNKLYAINASGKVSEYLDGGISKSGGNQDQLIDLLKYKIETLEPIVGFGRIKHQYVSLIKYLLKANRKPEAGILLHRVFHKMPGYLRQYRYWIKYYFS